MANWKDISKEKLDAQVRLSEEIMREVIEEEQGKRKVNSIKTELVVKSVSLNRLYMAHGGIGKDPMLVLPLGAALEIVGDAPSTYWGLAMLDAPDGRYYTTYPNGQANITPHGVDGLPKSFARTYADDPNAWFFGPLPLNTKPEATK